LYQVRFAPSPTGWLHVGGARTALINYLTARKYGGKFFLRIEDTDQQRSTEESITRIIEALDWLGLHYDGEIIYQSRRFDRHRQVALELIEKGQAYHCFCSPQELEQKRETARQNKENRSYDRACLHLSPQKIDQNLKAGKPFSVRLKNEAGSIEFTDLIRGSVVVEADLMDDFIILRPDGTPVYQLSVVVDDHDMGINLVLRGEDHLTNSTKQILLYQAMGWPVPQFGHLSLILGADKKRLSKRHGAASVQEFRDLGILPQALNNYLGLLGWSPRDEQEIYTMDEMSAAFDLERLHRSSAVFDEKKLLWLNGKHLAKITWPQLRPSLVKRLRERGLELNGLEGSLMSFMELFRVRVSTISEWLQQTDLFIDDPVIYTESGVSKYFQPEGTATLFGEYLNNLDLIFGRVEWNDREIEKQVREFATAKGLAAGKLIHPLRLALVGKTESPGIFELMSVLGKEKVVRRIEKALPYMQH